MEYEADPSWQRLVERRAHTHSGVDFWYGSLSERRLGRELRLQLNAPLTERIRFRYLRDEVANEEIEAGHERLELQVRAWGPLSFTVSGMGALEKSQAALGFGFLVADAARTRYLDLTIRNDAVVFDDRNPYRATDPTPPLRVIGETNLEVARSRLYGSVDWGLGHRRVFETPRGSGGVREREAWTRRAELKLEREVGEAFVVGVRHRYSGQMESRELFRGYVDPEVQLAEFDFRRDHHRTDLFAEKHWRRVRARGSAGFWRQTERAELATFPDYRVDRRQVIFGGRVIFVMPYRFELGAGYWGSYLDTRRTLGRAPGGRVEWEARNDEIYADKVDAVLTYQWGPTIRFEGVLSQEFTRGEFGGGSGKIVVLF